MKRYEETILTPLPVTRMWDIFGFTTEVDRLIGKPRGSYEPTDETASVSVRRLVTKYAGIPLVWEEDPWEFERNRFLSTYTKYISVGPIRSMRTFFQFRPAEQGTELTFTMEFQPAPGFQGLFAALLTGPAFRRALRGVKALLARAQARPERDPYPAVVEASGDPEILRKARQALAAVEVQDETDRALVEQLATYLASTNDTDVQRLRPYALARQWKADRHRVLRLLFRAAKAGALELEWAVICPDCQRAPKPPARLTDLRGATHCDTCAVTFDVDFAHNVEVIFRPAPAIRTADAYPFCLDNPSRLRNAAAMHILAPAEPQTFHVKLEPGMWRLRARRAKGVLPIAVVEGGPAAVKVELDASMSQREAVQVGTGDVTIEVRLIDGDRRLVAVERAAWLDDVATAAEVTASQEFRNFFPGEALAAGEQIAVRNLTFLFTDLKDSTAMYERVGDGPAYGTVSEHFRLLVNAIAAEQGALVKTIGDAVMAVFPSAPTAVRAALAMVRDMDVRNRERPDAPQVILKVGIHEGPCVAVNANGVLDYFGSTVNIAARVQGLSVGGDLVMTSTVARQPESAAAIADLPATPFTEKLKGLSHPFELVRVQVSSAAAGLAKAG